MINTLASSVVRDQWKRSILLLTTLVSALICFMPILFEWDFDYASYHEHLSAPIFQSMHSIEFKFSLVASIAISIPISIDFILDMASLLFDKAPPFSNGQHSQ